MFTFNVYVDNTTVLLELEKIKERLGKLLTKEEFDAKMVEVDEATTEIANDIEKLIAGQGGIPDEVGAQIQLRLDRLKAIGAAQ